MAAWPFGRAVLTPLRAEFERAGALTDVRREYLTRLASENPVSAFEWDDIHDAVCAARGLEPLPRLLDLASSATFAPELVYPDTRPALARLRAAGWRTALGTNGLARYQNAALEALDLHGFEATLTPDTTGFVKPQGAFLRALRDLTGDPAATEGLVHAGDLISQDVLAANRAGATAAWVWRDMPEDLRALSPAARAADGGVSDEVRARFEAELEHDGRIGEAYAEAVPRPDLVVPDLLDLAVALAPDPS
jgi:FMN phosphatase YigB (HAD superfamily)